MEILVPLFAGAALAVVLYGAFRGTRWGLNLERVSCPHCHSVQITWRKPVVVRRLLGGLSCEACGTSMDKWGRRRVALTARATSQ